MKELSKEEQAFRRGYSQGFFNARHPENRDISYQEVRDWRDNSEESPDNFPPGSYQRLVKKHDLNDPAFAHFSP